MAIVSFAVLAWTLLLWLLSPLLRRGERATSGLSPEVGRLRLVVRGAAAVDMAWLFGWFLLQAPVMGEQLRPTTRASIRRCARCRSWACPS